MAQTSFRPRSSIRFDSIASATESVNFFMVNSSFITTAAANNLNLANDPAARQTFPDGSIFVIPCCGMQKMCYLFVRASYLRL